MTVCERLTMKVSKRFRTWVRVMVRVGVRVRIWMKMIARVTVRLIETGGEC